MDGMLARQRVALRDRPLRPAEPEASPEVAAAVRRNVELLLGSLTACAAVFPAAFTREAGDLNKVRTRCGKLMHDFPAKPASRAAPGR
jgi:hypothetical protein